MNDSATALCSSIIYAETMPAERKHISDLASFRYTQVNPKRSAKRDLSLSVCDPESATSVLSREIKSNPTEEIKTDYTECE